MKRKSRMLAIIAAAGIVSGAAGSASSLQSCGYNAAGDYVENGTVYATASWDHAKRCAAQGLLPQVVAKRLGWLGDAATRAEAEQLRAENRQVREEREREEENTDGK
jgi:hypothetical protein